MYLFLTSSGAEMYVHSSTSLVRLLEVRSGQVRTGQYFFSNTYKRDSSRGQRAYTTKHSRAEHSSECQVRTGPLHIIGERILLLHLTSLHYTSHHIIIEFDAMLYNVT